MTNTYQAAVYNTFCSNAIRSAILIDDKFPTYGQLAGPERSVVDSFHLNKAQVLHKAFRDKKIICDIENDAEALDPDRIRKSDLVVLDYFLVDNDPTASIQLLQKLAVSKHLNLVVLFTSESLDEAWSRIAINLRGGWRNYDAILEEEEYIELWEDVDVDTIRDIDDNDLKTYILDGEVPRAARICIINDFRKAAADVGKDFPNKACQRFVDAWVHRSARRRVCCHSPQKKVRGSFTEKKWILVGNVFIAFQTKSVKDDHDAAEIMSCLHQALLDWRPNPIRLITSEIQNVLENEPLAFDTQLQEDLQAQAGWLFNFLKESDDIAAQAAIDQLLYRISGNIADRILSETSVPEFAGEILREQREHIRPEAHGLPKVAADAVGLSECNELEIVHALNLDLSIETFSHTHITTGTIFRDVNDGSWWVCVSPACDMVPKQKNGSFAVDFDPNRPAKVLRLEPFSLEKAIADAHQSRFIFVRDEKGKPLALSAYDGVTKQPDIWMIYIHNHRDHEGDILETFVASYLTKGATAPHEPVLMPRQFKSLYQLRPPYAARLQAHASHHTGRIGVDFVSWKAPALESEHSHAPSTEDAIDDVAEAV